MTQLQIERDGFYNYWQDVEPNKERLNDLFELYDFIASKITLEKLKKSINSAIQYDEFDFITNNLKKIKPIPENIQQICKKIFNSIYFFTIFKPYKYSHKVKGIWVYDFEEKSNGSNNVNKKIILVLDTFNIEFTFIKLADQFGKYEKTKLQINDDNVPTPNIRNIHQVKNKKNSTLKIPENYKDYNWWNTKYFSYNVQDGTFEIKCEKFKE
jgi:hypothetical protein